MLKLKKLANLAVTALLLASIVTTSLPGAVFAAGKPEDKDKGGSSANNGTLKVHDIASPAGQEPTPGTENNEPQVCTFNLEGFKFDVAQTGYILFNVQGGQNNGDQAGPVVSFGPTDSTGYADTIYLNDLQTDLVNGSYKATLYGKDINNPALPDMTDEKAKSKVFHVDCEDEEDPVYEVATASVSTEAATCETGEKLVYGAISNATFSGTANGTTGAGTYEVIATADDDARFAGNGLTKSFSGNLAGPLTGEACDEPEVVYEVATAVVNKIPATCDAGEILDYGITSNATFTSGTPDGTEGPLDYSVVATADADARFAGNQTTLVLTGTLAGQLTGERCEDEEEPVYEVAVASVTTEAATCETAEKLVYGPIFNALYSGTFDGTEGPADYEVVATAELDSRFEGNQTKLVFSGTLSDKLTGEDCVLGENPETPQEPETPVIPEIPVTTGGKGEAPAVLPATGATSPAVAFALIGGIVALISTLAIAIRKNAFGSL